MIKQILIVDDSRLMREAISKILLSCGLKKTSIAVVENGNDALDYLELYPVDLIICGDNLLDMSAIQLLQQLNRKQFFAKSLALILQQPQRLIGDISFLQSKQYRIIQKPFNKQALLDNLSYLTKVQLFTKKESNGVKSPPKLKQHSQPTVLIVDDEATNIDVAAGHLKGTYRIIAAKSGKQALQIINTHYEKIDLILLDIMMPEIDGYQVCETLQNNNKTSAIPIIFLTAKSEVSDITKGFNLGCVDYITKPLQGDILLARVATHIKLRHTQKQLAQQIDTLKEHAKLREDVEKITQHDLKGPLSSILFELPQINNAKIETSIKQSVNNVINMINRSLDLYKIEQGRYPLSPEQVSLTEVITDAMQACQTLAEQKGIILTSHSLDKKHLILGEKLLNIAIFNNLIKNAVEAAPDESEILIEISQNQLYRAVSITNQGAIPMQLRDTLFEKHTSSDLKKGSGLGTYSAKLMVEVQQGSIDFDIIDENFTVFTIELPKA